jgi:hypothetical protein
MGNFNRGGGSRFGGGRPSFGGGGRRFGGNGGGFDIQNCTKRILTKLDKRLERSLVIFVSQLEGFQRLITVHIVHSSPGAQNIFLNYLRNNVERKLA